jgi:polyferredoxin
LNLIKIRQIISIVVFFLFVLLFLGEEELSVSLAYVLTPFQFLPALMQTITEPAAIFTAGLIFIILITLIFGRVYCSFLCPLGICQDWVICASRKAKVHPKVTYSKPHHILRYTILALTFGALLSGFLAPVSLLDPYAWTGRIFTVFLQPLLTGTYNMAIAALKTVDVYCYPRQTVFIPWSVLSITAVFTLLILYLAWKHGRLYCNAICPVGSCLGLLAKFAVFQIRINQKSCSGCHRCAEVCRAKCIDPQNASIDLTRCVGCFDCLDACHMKTVSYQRMQDQSSRDTWSPARRGFIIAGVTAASGLLAFNSGIRALVKIPFPLTDPPPVTPPGSISAAHFTQACTACSLCVSICPTKVLTPVLLDYGFGGLLQPKMNFEKSYCDYECNVCGRVCPTGAIMELGLPEKKLTQIGEAELFKDVCVVFVYHQNCGACGEVCPTHAIRFTAKDNILYPEIDRQYCIGCGACQLACPTTPRSIFVHANPVHKKAHKYIHPKKPVQPNQSIAADQDFPF